MIKKSRGATMGRSLIAVTVACLGLWRTAPAQCVNAQWQGLSDVPGVNGAVWTGVEWDPDGPGPRPPVLVVGGSFDVAGSVFSNSVAMWDGERWSTMVGCIHPPIEDEGEVRALTVFNGDLIASGYGMVGPGDNPVEGVLRWDGAAWNPLGGLTGSTLDLLPYHGGIAATGTLSLPGDDEQTRAMLWNGSQWTRLGTFLMPAGQPAWIVQSTVVDGDLVVAGWIASADGVPVNGMARLTDGGWVDMGLPPGVICRTVAAHDGKLFTITQQDQDSWDFRVLVLEQGQWLDVTNLPADFFPQSLWDVNGELFLSSTGRMGGWNEQFADSTLVLHWNGTGWDGVGTDIGNVAVMFPFRGQVIGAGLVGGCDGHAAEGLAAWNGTAWRALGSGISYAVQGLAEFRGELVACGGLRTTNPAGATGLLALRDGSWRRLISQTVLGGMARYGNDLILAGVVDTPGLVRFDGTELQPIGPQGVFADRPVVLDGDLYCLGYDTAAHGYVVDRLDGSEWVQVGGRFGGPVSALFSHDGRLFVGGEFPIIQDDEFAGAIAVLDGENWVDPDSTVTARFQPLVVSCAAEFMGQVVIGGEFVVQGADWRPIAGWDGTTLSLIETPLPVWPNTMLVVGDELLMAGDGGLIVAWNGATWRVLGNLGTGVLGYWATVTSMILSGGDLVIGGSFASVDGHVANLVAKIRYSSCCGSADFNGDGDPGTDQDIAAFFACFAGSCCPTCGSADFNSDGDVGTDQDIDAFFRVLSGGNC